MCRLLPSTKILHCPQCIKTKINSSIKGRSYLKHLNCFFFFFLKFRSHLQMLAHKRKITTKQKKQKTKTKTKGKKKKKIKTNMVQLHKAFSEFT